MKNKKLTPKQEKLLDTIPMGKRVDVATSEYSLDPIKSTGWNPITRSTAKTIESLTKLGYIESDMFWRGATIIKVKDYI